MNLRAIAVLAVCLAACGPLNGVRALAEPTTLVHQHFQGLRALSTRPDLSMVQRILELKESQAVIDRVASRLAEVAPAAFGVDAPGKGAGLKTLVRLALESETLAEVRADEEGVTSWAVAIRMEGDLAEQMGRQLSRVLANQLKAKAPRADEASWEIAPASGGRAARFARMGSWAILGSGPDALEALRDRVSAEDAPVVRDDVYKLEADLKRLSAMLGWGEKPPGLVDKWPSVRLNVSVDRGRLKTEGSLKYDEPLELGLKEWRVPKDLVTDPLVGFTAMQNADLFLSRLPLLADLGIEDFPEQFFYWSLAAYPWQQYFAAPVENSTNLLAQAIPALPLKIMTNSSWQGQTFGLRMTNQATRAEMKGLPYFMPFMEAIAREEGDLIFGGLFLPPGKAQRAPEELLNQVAGRTNLLMYDYELTGRRVVEAERRGTSPASRGGMVTNSYGRLIQIMQLAQFGRILSTPITAKVPTKESGEVSVPGYDWVNAALPFLGETITEVTVAGPAELSVKRSSQLGFNSFELAALLRWCLNPGFPGWEPPPPPEERPRPVTDKTDEVTDKADEATENTDAAAPQEVSSEQPEPQAGPNESC